MTQSSVRSLPKPYYQDDAVTIYHGDCRNSILPECFRCDAIITDPPYGIGFAEYASHKDNFDSYVADVIAPLLALEQHVILGWIIIWQSARTMRHWGNWFPRDWFPIALPKTFTQVHPTRGRICAVDYALGWEIGRSEWPVNNARPRDWFVCQTSNMTKRPKGHPCPRPIDGTQYIVQGYCPPDGTILDPFMGSGTTLRAAKDLGRKAIGIEIEERYCEIAARRMAQEVLL